MARVQPGTAGWRFLTQAQFTALGTGGFRPNRPFRLSVTGAALTSSQGLALESAEGDIAYLSAHPIGQVQIAGEAAICAAILVNDGETPPNVTNLGGATIEIGYVEEDDYDGNTQAKG